MEAESTRIFDGQKVLLKETDRALTPFGGMVVFLEFLNKIGFVKKVIECMPVIHRSPNSIPPAQTYIAFLISVAAGARRFAQTSWLRGIERCMVCWGSTGSRAMTRFGICFCGSGWEKCNDSSNR